MDESKIGIIILSDIHYAKNSDKCMFASDGEYLTRFITSIEQEMKEKNIRFKYLLIAGDLVETGKRSEYKEVEKILEKIQTELNIEKKHILIVPGNHDLSRDVISSYCDEQDIPEEEASKHMDVKFRNYIEFYKNFTGEKDYTLERAIVGKLDFEECNISVLGLNSNVKESHRDQDHKGFIDAEKLREEIKKIDSGRYYLVMTHHSWADDRQKEIPTIDNAKNVKDILLLNNITTFLYGHHHAWERKNIEDENGVYQFCEIGSFSKTFVDSSYCNMFATAVLDKENLKIIMSKFILFQKDWVPLPNHNLEEIVFKKKESDIGENRSISSEFMKKVKESDGIKEDEEIKVDQDNVIVGKDSDRYLEVISKNKLYKEGHFHWSNGHKTHGWINISMFLGNNIILSNIRKNFKDFYTIIMNEWGTENIDAVIGYGMEGNIIGSGLTPFFLRKDIRYSYFPSVHRGKKFIAEEKILWNQATEIEKAIFVFDIIPSDDYIREIVNSNTIFQNLKEMYIFAVFWTNVNETLSSEIVLDTGVKRIQIQTPQSVLVRRFAACRLPINNCNADFRQCTTYINRLANIIEI